eukprot:4049412-Amphidinium_carterae.1
MARDMLFYTGRAAMLEQTPWHSSSNKGAMPRVSKPRSIPRHTPLADTSCLNDARKSTPCCR